jgi:hypothetical protein
MTLDTPPVIATLQDVPLFVDRSRPAFVPARTVVPVALPAVARSTAKLANRTAPVVPSGMPLVMVVQLVPPLVERSNPQPVVP